VLRGLIPRRSKSCGVSNPAEQHSKTNISANSKKNSKIFQGVNSGTIWGRFVEKTRGQKSCATVPLSKILAIALSPEYFTTSNISSKKKSFSYKVNWVQRNTPPDLCSSVFCCVSTQEAVYKECWPCLAFDILLSKYFPAG
jgi:hypothetical protein